MKRRTKKNPHGKETTIVGLQVCKLGEWDGDGPYALFVNVFDGGGIQVAEGTRAEMNKAARLAKEKLKGNWEPARLVGRLIAGG